MIVEPAVLQSRNVWPSKLYRQQECLFNEHTNEPKPWNRPFIVDSEPKNRNGQTFFCQQMTFVEEHPKEQNRQDGPQLVDSTAFVDKNT
jgi:hypothetical protein